MVCPREAFDYATGCCSGGERHVCASCETADKCCAHFEHCVSCCLSPENEPEKHMHSIYRGRNKCALSGSGGGQGAMLAASAGGSAGAAAAVAGPRPGPARR